MDIRPTSASASASSAQGYTPNAKPPELAETKPEDPFAHLRDKPEDDADLKEAFTEFVGQTMFGSMLASMRKSVGKPAYMHGGRTEEVFQKQLDQTFVEELTESSADSFSDPMFELFRLGRSA